MVKRVIVGCLVLGVWCAAEGSVEPVEVRVRQTAGGPQLFVDGVAVRPRWVYPSHCNTFVMADKGPKQHELEFDVNDAVSNLKVRFSFNKILRGKERENVTVRKVTVSGVAVTNGWKVVDNGSTGEGTISADGTLHADIHPAKETHVYGNFCFEAIVKAPAKGKCRLSFETLSSGDQPVYPNVIEINPKRYQLLSLGEDAYDKTIRCAAEAGVDFLTPPMDNCWLPPDKPQDWKGIDRAMRHAIEVNPHALIVPRVSGNMPGWMLKEHPEWYMRNDRGERLTMGSVSCRAYRKAAVEHIEKLARHLQETFPRNFAGLHVCGQNTGEWFYYHCSNDYFLGYDVATRDAFREWLAQRGEKDAATAEVPSAADRRACLAGSFHDPSRERRVMMFNAFQQIEIASLLNDFGAAIRRGTNGKSLAVFFYGYHWEIGGYGPESGTLGVGWLLEHGRENVDMLGAPISYGGRQKWPGTADVMSAAETLARAGVMWIHEDDTRTCKEPIWDFITRCGGPKIDKPQTLRTLRRNLAQDALRGFGCWWMDLFGRGWYADPDLWQVMRELKPLDEAMLRRKSVFSPEIACIVDEQSMLAPADCYRYFMAATMSAGRRYLSTCGAPYGQYLLSDVCARPLDAKLRFYEAAYAPSKSHRESMIADRLAHPERVRVWCWASGIVTQNGEDLAAARELTGFQLRRTSGGVRDVNPTTLGISRGLDKASWPTKYNVPVNLYTVETNSTDEVWATFANGEPAIVVRRYKEGGADVFCANFRFQGPNEMAAYARLAGVHLWTAPGEAAVWAAEGYAMVQALKAGEITVDFGNGDRRNIPFGLGDVKIFNCGVEAK